MLAATDLTDRVIFFLLFWFSMCPIIMDLLSPSQKFQNTNQKYFLFVCLMSLPYGLLQFVKTMMALGTSVRYLNRVHPLYVLMGGSCFALVNQLVFVLFSTIFKTLAATYKDMPLWLMIGGLNVSFTVLGGNMALSIFKKKIETEGINLESDFKQ